MRYLSIKNYAKYQHYKDRRPPWIKLHVSLLDDYDFIMLPDEMKGHLMLLWALASQMENKIPHDVRWITQRIGARSDVDVDNLLDRGFLEPWAEESARGRLENWSSRYVSAQTRANLLSAAQHRCSLCPATKHLEIDHIVPISQGGSGDVSNLQVLCRQCNRRKRSQLAEQVATQMPSPPLRSKNKSALLETETETETQKQVHPAVADLKGFAFMGFLRPVWREVYGGDLPPGSAKRLKPTVGEHGVSEVARRLRIYCESTPAAFASVPKFVSTFGKWSNQALQNGERMIGVGHDPTPEELASIGIKL